jgi:glycosyltransferase involved in cell wall biosynthesis
VTSMTSSEVRLGVVRDFRTENWPSMDLCADQLLAHVPFAAETISATNLEKPFRRLFTGLPLVGRMNTALNADRLLNRHWILPSFLHRRASEFDVFHIVDHSYAQLVHALPADRTGVYCHDLDSFRCLLQPDREPRTRWFRAIARRVLSGFQKAAWVFYSTGQIRQEIEHHGLVDPSRLVHAPYGVSPEFTPAGPSRELLPSPAIALGGAPFLLHVGSCIPRKRIDVLLDVFAAVRRQAPGLQLVKVGADWSGDQKEQIDRLGLTPHIVGLSGLERREIAALYRAAALVLLPSDSEGFGLPIIEALACGTTVVASDIPVLREVAGDAVTYCPVGDVAAWVEVVGKHLVDPSTAPSRSLRLTRAACFTWTKHVQTIAAAYLRLLS